MNITTSDFILNCGDLGEVKIEVECSVTEVTGGLSIEVIDAYSYDDFVKIDEDHLLELCKDTHRGILEDIKENISNQWHNGAGEPEYCPEMAIGL